MPTVHYHIVCDSLNCNKTSKATNFVLILEYTAIFRLTTKVLGKENNNGLSKYLWR